MDEPKYSQLDTLILENLKLQAQIQHLTAHIAALQARLDVQALEAQYAAHVQKITQESINGGDKQEEWKVLHNQWTHDPAREQEKLMTENPDRVSAHDAPEITQKIDALRDGNAAHVQKITNGNADHKL